MLTIRRLSQGAGFRYLMESIAVGDGRSDQSSALTRYYAESGTPAGVWLGGGLADLDGGNGVEHGSQVSEEQLRNMLGRIVDPISGHPVGLPPRRPPGPVRERVAERVGRLPAESSDEERAEQLAQIEAEEKARHHKRGQPVAGFDLTFSPSKSVSTAWALADQGTKAVIYECHRRAIDYTLGYAERNVFHSRSGKDGVLQEDVTGVVAASFTHYDSRSGDPQLHDHVVVWNRAKSASDGQWRTLDSRGIFKSVVTLSELCDGVLSDLLTQVLGVGWEQTSTRNGMTKHEIVGVSPDLMAEFSQRKEMIEVWRDRLVGQFIESSGRPPTPTELMHINQRANLETRQEKQHRSLEEMTGEWKQRAVAYLDTDPVAFVTSLKDRNDLPLLRHDDLADEMLAEVAELAVEKTAQRHSTFSRANVLAEVHRQLHGVRFASPDDRVAVAEHTTDMALAATLQVTAPELHYTPSRFRRADGTSRMRPVDHHLFTTATLLEAEARLLRAGQQLGGPVVSVATVAAVADEDLPGKNYTMSTDQAVAVEKIATSGRHLDVLVGPAGTGKSTTMAGLRAAWEAEHGPGSVIGLAPSAAAAEVLGLELQIDTENTAKWLHEWRQNPQRIAERDELRRQHPSPSSSASPLSSPSALSASQAGASRRADHLDDLITKWSFHPGQLVIVDEASLAGTFALDELRTAAQQAGAKVLLVGDQYQLSSVDAGGMFRALVAERGDLVPELSDVRRFSAKWEKAASVELRVGDIRALDAYEDHGRIVDGTREELVDALYEAWKADTDAGKRSLMIAGDAATVAELNSRARADRVAAGEVTGDGLAVSGGSAGVGDEVVTRENNRLLGTGKRWVKNGDRWVVSATNDDGSMAIKRAGGGGEVVLPADYVAKHVELAYATTAYRAQGQTVDCAHVMVTATTSREVLYVAVTRGRESNRLYVDTHYDPDPQTAHEAMTPTQSARQVLAGCLANRGADLAATDAIRHAQDTAESIPTLYAEYMTLAAAAQESRWDALLGRCGLNGAQLEAVRDSARCASLFVALREAEARGLAIEADLPSLVAREPLADVGDIAGVLRDRVRQWTEVAGSRRAKNTHLVVGLIPQARNVTDPEMKRALVEREQAMKARARSLVEQAIEADARWVERLGPPPVELQRRTAWEQQLQVVAAYRDKWGGSTSQPIGSEADVASLEQLAHYKRAVTAARKARTIANPRTTPVDPVTSTGQAVDMLAPETLERGGLLR